MAHNQQLVAAAMLAISAGACLGVALSMVSPAVTALHATASANRLKPITTVSASYPTLVQSQIEPSSISSADVAPRVSYRTPQVQSNTSAWVGATAAGLLATLLGAFVATFRRTKPEETLALLSMAGEDAEAPSSSATSVAPESGSSSEAATPSLDGPVTDVDLDNMSPKELEVMYINALWAYYTEGKALLTDKQFEKLREELNWQGSGFPTLHRDEIQFVQAILAYAKGEPSLSDEEYDQLKQRVNSNGKSKEVVAFLVSVKGKQTLAPEEYAKLRGEMKAAGVQVSPDGFARTLSETPNTLQYQVAEVLYMYSALGLVPTAISAAAWGFLGFIFGGLHGIATMATVGFPLIGGSSFLLTREMIRYLDLTGPRIVKGVCPCCEQSIEASFFDVTPLQKVEKCSNCGTLVNLDADRMLIKDAAGFIFVGDDKKKTVDQYLSWASGVTSGILVGKNPVSQLGGRKSDSEKPKPETIPEMVQQEITTGIFAWAVLLGYGIFGETFVARARGKGIALHSGVINDFCKRFNIPNGLRQKYIQTAKRNGHDLGFLVDGYGMIGNGLFGKQAMAWWKSTGW